MLLSTIRWLALAAIILGPTCAMAQTSASPTATSTAQLLKPAELDQLVAPIALYPDPLLAQVLMASAYPLDIVQAERWLEANKNLKGEALKAAVDKQSWDDSIKSLVATPDVLQLMSSKLDWTQKLGDAVVAQQADVMDAIQRLRTKAQANNKLQSTKQQKVTVQQVQNRQVIAIEPTDPDMVYVPYYDPGVVYGDWPYADYPPYYWPTPGYIGAGIIAAGIGFGAGYALGRWHGGNYWGGGFNWNNNNINVRPGGGGAGTAWRPSVDHRQSAGNRGNRSQQLNFRGSGGQQVIKPGGAGNRGNAGRNRPANRASAGAGNRPNAGTRPSGGGQRHQAAQRSNRGGGGNRGAVNRGGGGARVSHHVGGGGGAAMRARGGGGGGGGMHAGGGMRGGGGGMRGGGGGGRGGGGRRSDIMLKHDITLLGHLDNGLGFYRFSYNGSDKAYVGVMAQEVQQVMPEAVARGRDGYLRVYYDQLGVTFESYAHWLGSGAQVPHGVNLQR
jgi:hypothetical protein